MAIVRTINQALAHWGYKVKEEAFAYLFHRKDTSGTWVFSNSEEELESYFSDEDLEDETEIEEPAPVDKHDEDEDKGTIVKGDETMSIDKKELIAAVKDMSAEELAEYRKAMGLDLETITNGLVETRQFAEASRKCRKADQKAALEAKEPGEEANNIAALNKKGLKQEGTLGFFKKNALPIGLGVITLAGGTWAVVDSMDKSARIAELEGLLLPDSANKKKGKSLNV